MPDWIPILALWVIVVLLGVLLRARRPRRNQNPPPTTPKPDLSPPPQRPPRLRLIHPLVPPMGLQAVDPGAGDLIQRVAARMNRRHDAMLADQLRARDVEVSCLSRDPYEPLVTFVHYVDGLVVRVDTSRDLEAARGTATTHVRGTEE